MYKLLKALIFRFSPEQAHELTMKFLSVACAIPGLARAIRANYWVQHPSLRVNVAGLQFPNPVGLAAGFDKDAKWLKELETLGFGFVEIGTVTPRAQASIVPIAG